MKLRTFVTVLSLAFSFGIAQSQPNWSTTPTITSVGALNVTVNFGIDVSGTVYIIVFNSNVTTALTSNYVRNNAISGPSGGLVATAVITVTAGQATMTLSQYFDLFNVSRMHAMYLVAANSSGTLQASPVRLGFTTLACPSMKLTTYFGNLGECVNNGSVGMYSPSPIPTVPTGVLKGTVWTVDWGDGNTWSYTSTADGDIPSATHNFTTITDCNYVGTWTVQNPCGEFLNGSSVFVVHGREIPTDGDGDIQMQETVTGDVDITYVCEGAQHIIFLRDITTWNCQDPTVPPPLTAKPNTSNRNFQFVYGETPAGAIMNTITGDVYIGGSNIANSSDGYIGPVLGPYAPPNPNVLTDAITIPATCKAGERFYVYEKYWNKCNPYVSQNLDYVDDFFIIEIIAAPPAPNVTSPNTYCFGNVAPTLSATPNLSGNTINWYADAGLTTLLYTGTTFTHGITAVGTYTFYATETSGVNTCEGHAAPVVLNIIPVISNNTIAASQNLCSGVAPAGLTGSTPTGGNGTYAYLWQSSTTSATSGFSTAPGAATGINYTIGTLSTTTWFRRLVTSGPCTDYSTAVQVTVYSPLSAGVLANPAAICYNTAPSAAITASTAASGGSGTYTYQWQSSPDNSVWSNITGATGSSYTPGTLTTNTYYRRIVTDALCGSATTASVLLIVADNLTGGSIADNQTICYNTVPAAFTQTAAPTGGLGTYYYRWYISTNGSSWTQISGANSSTYAPSTALTANRYYRRRVSNTCGTQYSNNVLVTVLGQLTPGTIGTAQSICYNTDPAALTELTPATGGVGTYTYQWQSSTNNSTWTNITGATSASYDPGSLTGSLYFRRVVTSGSCGSANSASVLITVYNDLTPGTIGSNQSVCYNTAPSTLTELTAPSGGTGSNTYQWQSSPNNSTWSNVTGATASTYSPPALTATTYYRRNVINTCGTVSSAPVTITVMPDLTPGSIGSVQTICYNTAPATLTQVTAPTGANGTYSYQWQSSTDNITFTNISGATSQTYTPGALTVPTYFRRGVISGSCTPVYSASVLVSLYSTLTLAQLNSDASICNNSSTNFMVAITGGTSPYTVNYTRNGVAQTAITNYISGSNISTGNLSTGSYVYALTSVTDSHGCTAQSLGTSITIIAGASPTAATFTGSGDVCYNTASYLTSTITGGAPPYRLSITGYAGSPVNNFYSGDQINLGVLAPGTYTYVLTAVRDNCGNNLASGLPITYSFTVFGQLLGGTIGSAQSICFNTVPASFTNVTGPSGGTALTYQWQSSPAGSGTWTNISGATGLTYTETNSLTASTDYRRATTSGNSCGTVYSNIITVTVYPDLTPGAVGSPQSICYNTTPSTLTQSSGPSGGNGTYAFQWQSSADNSTFTNISGATSSTYSPGSLTSTTYYRRNTTSGSCGTVSSASVKITVYPDLTPGTVGSAQIICYGATPSTLTQTAAPTGGTGAYTYQWQSSTDNITFSNISGATATSYSPGALTTTTYYRRNITSGSCGTVSSASVKITVYADLTSGAVGSPQSICYGTTPAGLTETTAPTGGTTVYTYQWQSSPDNLTWTNVSGAASVNYSPGSLTATTYYRRNVTSGSCGTVSSPSVKITVYDNLTPGSIGSAQTICYNTVPVSLNEVTAPTGGTGIYSYQWESSTDNISWNDISGATSANYTPPALTANTYFRRDVTSDNCGTVIGNSILITVYPQFTPGSVGSDQTLCYNTVPAGLTELTTPAGGTGSYTYQWQRSYDNVTYTDISGANTSVYSPGALTSTTWYRRNVTSGGCGTLSSAPVKITVYAELDPGAIGSPQSICYNTAPSGLTELTAASGGTGTYTYQWQSSADNSFWSNIPGATLSTYSPGALTAGIYYRRVVTSGSCGTVYSASVYITVFPNLTAGSIGNAQTICETTAPSTLTELTSVTGGTGTYSYQWESSTDNSTWTAISGANLTSYSPGALSVSTYYRRNVTSGSCGTLSSNVILVTVTQLPDISTQSASVCSGETLDHFIILDNYTNPGDGVTFTWPAPTLDGGLTGGTARTIPSSANLTDVFINVSGLPGTATYYVTPHYNGCDGYVTPIVVTVGSQPVLANNLNRSVCSRLATGLVLAVDAASVPATTYNIVTITRDLGLVADPANVPAANGVADNYLAGDKFTNKTGVDKTVTYRVRPIYGLTCIGDPVDVVVTIHPEPVIQPGQTATVCSNVATGKEIYLVPLNQPGGTLFSWNMPVMDDGSVQGTSGSNVSADPAGTPHLNDIFVNYSAAPITATYSVVPVSSNGCAGDASDIKITINPEPPAPVISGDNEVCTGTTNIVYTVPLTAGSSYIWTVPASVGTKTFDFNSNAIIIDAATVAGSGNIEVRERNSYGCTGVAGIFPVSVVAPVSVAPVTGDNVVCALETATYSVPANIGSVYTWTVPTGAAIIGDNTSNSIMVTFSTIGGNITAKEVNSAGCETVHTPLAVTVNPQPTAVISNSGTVCSEDTFPVNVALTGTAPFTFVYAINGAAQGPVTTALNAYTINASMAGTYTIISVTDANLCAGIGSGTAIVNFYTRPTATISGTTEICNGKNTQLTISLTGTPPFTFTYTDGVTPVTISSFSAVTYTVFVNPIVTTTYTLTALEDGHTCEGDLYGSAVITVNDPPVLTATGTDLTCNGNNSGSIDLTVTGLASPFSYSWTGPGGFSAATEDVTGLAAGTYSVIVTDSKGCSSTTSVVLGQPTPLTLGNTGNISLLCFGSTNGTGTFTASGGVPPYTFSNLINTAGATLNVASPNVTVSNASIGTITEQVTDANGCTASSTINITQPTQLALSATLSISSDGAFNINCFGGSTGSIIPSVTGGTAPYSYSWSTLNGSGLVTGASSQTALTAGTYQLTVADANGCTINGSYTLTQPPQLVVNATADDYTIGSCASSIANLTATVTGGVPLAGGVYYYNWTPSAGLNYSNVQNPVAKPAVTTTYTLTVTDRNGCTASTQVTINVAPPISLNAVPVTYAGGYNIKCNNGSDGQIDLTVTGGESPYVIAWTGPSSFTSASEDISGLKAGTYGVTVTDVNGCAATTTVILYEPALLTISKTPDYVLSCFGDSNGSGSFSISGGTSPYNISVVTNTAAASVNVLPAGFSFTGGHVGEVTILVTDDNGCTVQETIYITQPDQLLPGTIDGTQEVCYLGDPLTLNSLTSASGGPSVITYQWERSTDGGTTWNAISGATALSYDPPSGIAVTTSYRRRAVSATCSPVYSNVVTVTINPLPAGSIAGTGLICPGNAATLTVTLTAGESPYTIVLSDGTTVNGYVSGTAITVYPVVTTTYTISSITDNNGCSVTAPHANITGSATININSAPEIISNPANLTLCEGQTATFSVDAGSTASPSYQWYFNPGTGAQIMTGETSSTLSFTATSALNGYTYYVVVSGMCPSPVTSTPATLNVLEAPEITVPPTDVSVCAGEDAILTVNSGSTANAKYQWYVNSGSGWNAVSGTRYLGGTNDTLTIVSVIELMSGYQYRVRVTGDCAPYAESAPVTLTVVHQAEITQQPSSQESCEGTAATFTVNAGLTTNPTYQWQLSTDGVTWTNISGATSATYTIPSVTSAMNDNMYRVIVTSTCGSAITSLPVYLVVDERPEIITQPSDAVHCVGEIANFVVDAGNTTGASYQWQISTDSGVTWNNLSESAKYFGVQTSNLKINGVINTMDGYMFRVIVNGTCTPSVTSNAVRLTVNTPPVITVQPSNASICENTSTSFSVTAAGSGLTYQWYVDQGDGLGYVALGDTAVYSGATTATLNLTNVPVRYDNYRYRVVVIGTCSPAVSSTIVILDVTVVTAILQQPVDTAVCEFSAVSFSVDAVGANLAFQWQVNSGTTWSNVTNGSTYMGATTNELTIFGPSRVMDGYHYRVIIGSSCSPDLTSGEASLMIYTSPSINDQPDNITSCPGQTASFTVGASGSGLNYQWQINSGSGFVTVSEGGDYSGTTGPTLTISNLTLAMNGYLVRAVVSGMCVPPIYSSFAVLNVYAEPSILTQPVDADVCDNSTVIYYAQVYTTAAGETMQWQVDQGSGWTNLSEGGIYSGTQGPQLVISSATTSMNGWHYRLQITGPCGTYYSNTVLLTVNAMPDALISPQDTMLVCGGVATQLHGNPTGGTGTYVTHSWFGDVGPLSAYNIENPVFRTTLEGYYDLIYRVTDSKGCIGMDTVVVEVEKPSALFTSILYGCQPLVVTFTNSSAGYASLLWDFGDGETSTEVNPTHTFRNTSTSLVYYTVTLTVTSSTGCTASMQSSITVYPEVTSDFIFSKDPICSGETVTITSMPGSFLYYWNYGDGEEGNGAFVVSHKYYNYTTAPVTYNVTLTTTSFFGCESATTQAITVYPTPIPAFTAVPVSQTMPNSTVTFTNGTSGTWTWLWRFGNGATSTQMSPVYTYGAAGTFAVTLVASNGVCSDSIMHSVSVLPTPPVANFDSIPSGCQVHTIALNNTSLYATSYMWDFGDGSTSTAMNPTYSYTTPGVYRVTLTVTGPGGTDSKSRLVNVYPSPKAYFEVSPTTVYVNDEKVRCYNLSEGAAYYVWEFGDGDTSHVADPYHKYSKEGVYDITLHAYSSNGCYDTYVLSPAVTVMPFGTLGFATVFRPNQTGEIDLDHIPQSGDEVDQFFYPPIRETVVNYHMQIFNRWGTLIYESYDINRPWNGYYKHKLCPQGVYVWLVEGKYANGRPFKKVGDITLLH